MPSYKPDSLLAQIPLTVSPFISLPSAPVLSYNYRQLPSTLPPSLLAPRSATESKPAYIVSRNGHAAHADEILASCAALEQSLAEAATQKSQQIRNWEESIRQSELAEKRRVAPGWLDREERLLQPSQREESSSKDTSLQRGLGDQASGSDQDRHDMGDSQTAEDPILGAALDRLQLR